MKDNHNNNQKVYELAKLTWNKGRLGKYKILKTNNKKAMLAAKNSTK